MPSFTLTVSTEDAARVNAALRARIPIEGGEGMSNLDFGKAAISFLLSKEVLQYEQQEAYTTAVQAITSIEIT